MDLRTFFITLVYPFADYFFCIISLKHSDTLPTAVAFSKIFVYFEML